MFLGEYSHTLDGKGRLTIPARYRAELSSGLVITKGYDPCLVVYPSAAWAALAERVAGMPAASRTVRSVSRWVFGSAFETNLDKMGRVLIPSFLRDYTSIAEEAMIVGGNTYFEIWSPARLQEMAARDAQNLETTLEEFTRMSV